MQSILRGGFSVKNSKWLTILRTSYDEVERRSPGLGFAEFSSSAAEGSQISDFSKKVSCRVIGGNCIIPRDKWTRQYAHFYRSTFQVVTISGQNLWTPCFVRCIASETTESKGRKGPETRKEISTVEDPFDSPTYNIPEKPVTFAEGASYSLVILAGLGIAGAAACGVFKELIFEPKEYKIFNKALDRVQTDSQVRVRIGSPITGYGSESRNRAARQRIPHKTWIDEDGVEHIMVNFHIRGSQGAGKVYTEMFLDKVDRQWKFMYLIVEVTSPSPAQLMLESYVPA